MKLENECSIYALSHLKKAMATNDVRYYLNGINCQVDSKGKARFIATNGHALHTYTYSQFDSNAIAHNYTISKDVINALTGLKLTTATDSVIFEYDTDTQMITVHTLLSGSLAITQSALDGKYPDTHTIINNGKTSINLECRNVTFNVKTIREYIKQASAKRKNKQGKLILHATKASTHFEHHYGSGKKYKNVKIEQDQGLNLKKAIKLNDDDSDYLRIDVKYLIDAVAHLKPSQYFTLYLPDGSDSNRDAKANYKSAYVIVPASKHRPYALASYIMPIART